MRAFIDGFKLIRIESDIYIHTIELNNNQVNWLKNENFNQFFATEKPICLHQDDHIVVNDARIPLEIGVVTLSKEFEQQFRYDGALGVDYRQDRSTFRLFTPVAKEVDVVIDQISYPMVYEMPIWMTTVFGDLEGKAYHFSVRLVDTFDVVNDPYAIGAGLHKNHIIDWNKTIPIHPSNVKLKHPVDAVLYEGHVRDLTIHLDVESKGLFDGLIEKSKLLKTSVIGYVKKLGITHLQLLPVYDFEGVDDVFKTHSYNWGYNPSQFFCVEGWFSKDPNNPYDRIDGFKKVINEAHRLGLGINMDVVFNHVYQYWTFPYDHLVPGYFYRHNARHKMTDASYCGNDIETRNYMVRKLIIDNLKHWVTHYQVDGFRFDLMGLLDLETMQKIETALKKIHPSIMLYGEGWNMPSEVPARLRSNMANQAAFPKISHFNDSFRHVMKGELHGPGLGYAMGNHALVQKAMQVIIGSPMLFTSPNQSINYVECHDNLTFYDKMLLSCGFENPNFTYCQDLANHIIAISQGVPFYHAGQEFYRSKKGVENAYNSPDEINRIHWPKDVEPIKKLKKLLKLRKRFKLYRMTSYGDQIVIRKERDLIVYQLEDAKHLLIHYIKNKHGIEELPLVQGQLIFPSQAFYAQSDAIIVDQPGVYIVHIKK